MRRIRLIWQLFPSFLLVVIIALAASTWYISLYFRAFHLEQIADDLEVRARLIEVQAREVLPPSERPQAQELIRSLGQRIGTRVTLILPDGQVLGDSMENPERMENHAGRPEVRSALEGKVGRATRYSSTLDRRMMYVAIPVLERGAVGGVVRTALSLHAIDQTLANIYRRVALGGLIVGLLAAGVSLWLSRRISRPLEEIKEGAHRFAEGNLKEKLVVGGTEEIAALAEVLNRMSVHLDERMRTVLRQRNEQEAVLSSMVEGVLAIDAEERILRLNHAAARLLSLAPEAVKGRPIQEVIRKADLQRFVSRTLASRQSIEGDILIRDPQERYLQAHGTPLRDPRGQEIGALIVLNDVTRIRRLETIRRDFVANVSHELKTPITAIKGSAETLLDGASEDPEMGRRFVHIILKQADRLNAIIEDLLALSRIEQGVDQEGIPLQVSPILPVLRSSLQDCQSPLREKELEIELRCPEELRARINSPLLEQAVVNLLTNAIKYSEPQGRIRVEGRQEEGSIVIRVQDWGCGIPKEHLPRLFERFYRVDKARSRRAGGTGLGLAIVKHIVQAHEGTVRVESVSGKGSTFSIVLPSA